MEFGLLAAALMAVACLWLALRFEVGRTNPSDQTARLFDSALIAAIVGLGIGRIGTMVSGGVNPLSHPLDILIVRGGVDTVVASAGALAVFAIIARRDLPGMADTAAPAALAGLAGWHAGCFTRGACLGTPADLPWAIAGPSGIGRHPVEVYAAVALALAWFALILIRRRRSHPGIAASLAIAVAAGARLATEPMRPTIGGGPIWWYNLGVAAGLAAAITAWVLGRRRA
ncbi:MAG: prolipoprotein diacylglyceryl transferase family protein [Actinomycetota bacterium]